MARHKSAKGETIEMNEQINNKMILKVVSILIKFAAMDFG